MADSRDRPDVAAKTNPEDPGQSQQRAAAVDLQDFADSPERVELLLEVFSRGFAGEIDENTFEEVRDAGILLAGADGFAGLVWVADDKDPLRNLAVLELPKQAEQQVVKILALYGRQLRTALHLSDVPASRKEDWDAFGARILLDPRSGEPLIHTEIVKYNGEALHLKAGLASLTRLTDRMLSTLLQIDSFESLDEVDRENLRDSLSNLSSKLDEEVSSQNDSSEQTR